MLALTKLAKTYDMELRHDYVAAIAASEEHAMRSPEMARRWSDALWGSSDTAIAGVALDIDAVLRRDARLLTHDFI